MMKTINIRSAGGMKATCSTRKYDNETPLITVATVVFNGGTELQQTIQSVLNQTYQNIEYIIIDGGSHDESVSIITSYEDKIDYWVSEKDRGIYDAMNKAIKLANGEWINFMNAGDRFASTDVIERIFSSQIDSSIDYIFGQHFFERGTNEKIFVKTRPLSKMWQRICFCHQSLFTRTILMKERPFDLTYRIVCDYENYFTRYMEGKKFHKVDLPVAVFKSGGYSEVNFFKRTIERFSVVRKYRKDSAVIFYYIKLILAHYYTNYFLLGSRGLLRKARNWFLLIP